VSFLKMLKNVNISERKCHYDNNNNISEYFFSLQAQLLHILNRWTKKIKIALFFVMLWGFFWTYPPKPHLLTLSHIQVLLTIYSEGAMNSIVEDLISGRLCGSPYVFVTGSNENSSGTERKQIKQSIFDSSYRWNL